MSAVDDFQAATEQLAGTTEREALAVYADLVSDRIPPDDAILLIAALINRANAEAVSLADVWLAVQIEEQTGQPVPTVGVVPVDDSERLVKAVNTVLTDAGHDQPRSYDVAADTGSNTTRTPDLQVSTTSESRQNPITADQTAQAQELANGADAATPVDQSDPAESRIARLARAEPLEAAQQATHEAMQQQPLVEGWIRQMDADPCQLCRWWWREGRVWPKAHPMPRHTGCNCQPKVVVAQFIKSTQFTRQLARNDAI